MEDDVSGDPKDKRVDRGVSLGGSPLNVVSRLASSGEFGGGVRVCRKRFGGEWTTRRPGRRIGREQGGSRGLARLLQRLSH